MVGFLITEEEESAKKDLEQAAKTRRPGNKVLPQVMRNLASLYLLLLLSFLAGVAFSHVYHSPLEDIAVYDIKVSGRRDGS